MTSVHETRAMTLVECLQRLERVHANEIDYKAKNLLTAHLLGADHREGNTGAETFEVFRRFTHHVATQTHLTSLKLVLVGPNLSSKLHLQQFLQSYQSKDKADTKICRVDISYFVGGFEAYFSDKTLYCSPDLVVCFNAGIWGYDEWLPAIRLALREVQVPLLITSYNEHEAEDDEDVLEELTPFKWLWRPEKNPYGASTLRATDNNEGRILKENNHWMCLTGRPR
ncbi:unnamed protein product [Peronospora destructor]|uniref:Mitochondrial splicing suppressor 51-like C-terminal domain-containing protein n=1 Tax=Peronospora destructor TaxID=86335 RepID=A0AAV0VE91_9STRA|nr:unnamed protein product [Peronospora destructor]